MALFTVIVVISVLGVIVWLVQAYLPIPTPFKVIIQLIVVVLAIYLLLSAVGIVPPVQWR